MISLLAHCTIALVLQPTASPLHRRGHQHSRGHLHMQKRDEAGFLAEEELGDWVSLGKSTDLGATVTEFDLPEAAKAFVEQVQANPEAISFDDTMSAIAQAFDETSVSFTVGDVKNAAGSNMGSAKIFSFAKLAGLDEATTLQLFGDFYRKDVLDNPDGDDHQNIRNFMKVGWEGVTFPFGLTLSTKEAFAMEDVSVEEALAASASISGSGDATDWD